MKSSESTEFWADDAAAIAERERIQRTGHRMPAAAGSQATQARKPSIANGRDFKPFNDVDKANARHKQLSIAMAIGSVVGLVVAATCWLYWPTVTLKEFERIQPGMTVAECNSIIGTKGTTVMQSEGSELMQHQGVVFMDATEFIQWKNNGGSNAVAAFVDGKLFIKVQIGLTW